MYRRPASRYRRMPYMQVKEEPDNLPLTIQEEAIPLPNEADVPLLPLGEEEENTGAFRFLGRDFFLDDIILIGLLILLIQERVEDEILLIIIAYIFLF